jgi:hypothetical protein
MQVSEEEPSREQLRLLHATIKKVRLCLRPRHAWSMLDTPAVPRHWPAPPPARLLHLLVAPARRRADIGFKDPKARPLTLVRLAHPTHR